MYETTVTVVGNVVDAPILRRTTKGVEVANFRIASTSRRYDRAAAAWVDQDSLFLGVTCWRQLAVNVAGVLVRGDPVVVTGRLCTRSYEADGRTRSSYEVQAVTVGPDLARLAMVWRTDGAAGGGRGADTGPADPSGTVRNGPGTDGGHAAAPPAG